MTASGRPPGTASRGPQSLRRDDVCILRLSARTNAAVLLHVLQRIPLACHHSLRYLEFISCSSKQQIHMLTKFCLRSGVAP